MGGVANFLIAPLFGIMHITTACGVDIAPPLLKVTPPPALAGARLPRTRFIAMQRKLSINLISHNRQH
jgi:hypothetical protein